MDSQFKTIGIIGKPSDASIADTLITLFQFLTEQHFKVVIAENSAAFINDSSIETYPLETLGEHCDLIIAAGGDGTFLSAAHSCVGNKIPLIGINLGRVGFLVDISPKQMLASLKEILAGNYKEEPRYFLNTRIIRDNEVIHEEKALNEVVIHRWVTPSMIEITTHIDGQFLNSQRSDGLIVSTPTGSTAYSLSAGGPILHPALNALVLVPLNPNTLSNRPIVINDDAEIEISFCQTKQINALVTCDYLEIPEVLISDKILIKKVPTPIKMLHPQGYDFFNTLREKLNWSYGNQ
ncbi:MAG: NAD(+) kinase [Methylococcaceae bacterium]|nr:NAD(+) kinase [Methylococcaceae bacterium]